MDNGRVVRYYTLRIAGALVAHVPLEVAYRVAAAIAQLVFVCWRSKRGNTVANMRVVLGPDAPQVEVVRMAARSMRNYGRYLVDFVRFPYLSAEHIVQVTDVDPERAAQIFDRDSGVLFVTLHFGNWDMAGAWLGSQRPLHVVAETFPSRKLNDFVQGTRRRLGMFVWPMEGSLLRLMRSLRSKEILAILIDRPGQDGVPVRFFDSITRVPAGAAALALRAGAPVVTGGMVANGDGTYRAVFDDTIIPQRTGDDVMDIQELTQQIMTSLEQIVRRNPDQWYMFRRMFQPDAVEALVAP